MKSPLRPKTWILLGTCAAAIAYGLTAPRRGVVLPTEWEACSAAGVRAMEAGRLGDAERYFLRALDEASQPGGTDARLGTSLENLASVRKAQRRYRDAEVCIAGRSASSNARGRDRNEN